MKEFLKKRRWKQSGTSYEKFGKDQTGPIRMSIYWDVDGWSYLVCDSKNHVKKRGHATKTIVKQLEEQYCGKKKDTPKTDNSKS